MIKEIWIEEDRYIIDVSYYTLKKIKFKKLLEEVKKIEENTCSIVAINSDYVISLINVIVAIQYALRAFKRNKNISRMFPIEVLLYLAGRREISTTLEYFSSNKIIEDVIIAIICKNKDNIETMKNKLIEKFRLKESEIPINVEKIKRIREFYNITNKEIETTFSKNLEDALVKLIAIRSAFLSIT